MPSLQAVLVLTLCASARAMSHAKSGPCFDDPTADACKDSSTFYTDADRTTVRARRRRAWEHGGRASSRAGSRACAAREACVASPGCADLGMPRRI